MVDYSAYFSAIAKYQRVKLGETERSSLLRIINAPESTSKIASYFKLKRRQAARFNDDHYASIKILQNIDLIEDAQEEKFLRGATYYRLTTWGLFYTLSNMVNYPPQLFMKYQNNVILKTLLYPYFEADTIENCTSRLYSVLTQYLHEACNITLDKLEAIKSMTDTKDKERHIKGLQFDLESHAKVLGFKLAVMYNESNILTTNPDVMDDNAKVALYELESSMKIRLSRDNRFMQFLQVVQKDCQDGYKELTRLKERE
jgi:hypothetical protein